MLMKDFKNQIQESKFYFKISFQLQLLFRNRIIDSNIEKVNRIMEGKLSMANSFVHPSRSRLKIDSTHHFTRHHHPHRQCDSVSSVLSGQCCVQSVATSVRWTVRLPLLALIILLLATSGSFVDALKRRSPLHSDVIEEVEAKRLEKLIQEQDFIAVFFCK